jgi:hypothetical protein
LQALVATMNGILGPASKLLAEVADPPSPGSAMAMAHVSHEREAFDQAFLFMFATEENLNTICSVIQSGRIPPFSLFTLLRSAGEAVCRARPLLEPNLTHADRVARGLNKRLDNLRGQGKLDTSTYSRDRVAKLNKRADDLGITMVNNKTGELLGYAAAAPSIFDLFEAHMPTGKTAFRYLSAFTHSRPWALVPRFKFVKSADPLVGIARPQVDIDILWSTTTNVLGVYEECVRLWVSLAGFPVDVWTMSVNQAIS